MMRDTKAAHAAELIRKYCRERGCASCIFYDVCARQCVISHVRSPAWIQMDDVRKRIKKLENFEEESE